MESKMFFFGGSGEQVINPKSIARLLETLGVSRFLQLFGRLFQVKKCGKPCGLIGLLRD